MEIGLLNASQWLKYTSACREHISQLSAKVY